MNRNHLERAAETLAARRGYAFVAAPDQHLPLALATLPAAVLAPLALHSVEGHRHGRAIYDLTLRLLCAGARLAPEARRTALATLEDDLLSLLAELSEDDAVIAIEGLALCPAEGTLTPHGELSQTATARILTHF